MQESLRPMLLKKTPAHVLSCDFCQIFQNIFLQNTGGWLLLLNTLYSLCRPQPQNALHKKWSFPLRISSVNLTKSAFCGWGQRCFAKKYTEIFVQWYYSCPWLILMIVYEHFLSKYCQSLREAISGNPRQLAVMELVYCW